MKFPGKLFQVYRGNTEIVEYQCTDLSDISLSKGDVVVEYIINKVSRVSGFKLEEEEDWQERI